MKGVRLRSSNLFFEKSELFHESVVGFNNEPFVFQEPKCKSRTSKRVEESSRKCTSSKR